MDIDAYKIAIAAFLHDIGKFAERGEMGIGDFGLHNADLYQPFYNNRHTHKHALYTAAFIDRIEKILPKEFNRGDWGLDDPLINLAAGHHKPETPLQWIVAIADRVSSGFDRSEFDEYNKEIGVSDYRKTRLLTIFEGITTKAQGIRDSLDAYKYRYSLKELSPVSLSPIESKEGSMEKEEATRQYKALFENFVDALEKLKHRRNIPLWIEHFDSLFMIYASHIPAATVGKVVPDVSLYDHSKTTAAIASALYKYHLQGNTLKQENICNYDEKKFLLVTGDFFGIQNYIFSEGGSTKAKAAKLLRGRSFSISLMAELAADMLCRELGLTPMSVVLNAAGKFTLIAQNTEDAKTKINDVENKITDWLVKHYFGEAAFGLTSVEASCNDFSVKESKFSALLDAIGHSLEWKKNHKIDLERYGGVTAGYLDSFNNKLGSRLCPYCGKRPSHQDVENASEGSGSSCKICSDHIYLGTKLVKEKRIGIFLKDAEIFGAKLSEPIFGEYQVSLDISGNLGELAETGHLVKYWDISRSAEGKIEKEITAKFVNCYIPIYSENDLSDEALSRLEHGRKSESTKEELFDTMEVGMPKTFLEIAKSSLNKSENNSENLGIEALGVLKADLDNLGKVFACGLRRLSISRMATLSRQLNHFFTICLPYRLQSEKEYRDIYTVFAGGDDLFLIGPWNRIIAFSVLLKEEFDRYVCGNKELTFSAGISLNKPGEPVSTIRDRAEESLQKSKNTDAKDSVTLFGETVRWSEFQELEEIRKVLEQWVQKDMLNSAMLFRFNEFSGLAKREKELLEQPKTISAEDWECLSWRSKFKYSLVRNIGKQCKGEEKNKVLLDVEKTAHWLEKYRGALKIPIWQIIYNNR